MTMLKNYVNKELGRELPYSIALLMIVGKIIVKL